MSALSSILSLTMVAQTVRMSVPYACAAMGGVWSERSGVVNIALEGTLLASGFAAVVAQHASHSALVGTAAAIAAGAAFALVHALLVARGRVDAIVSGIALNLIAAGGTRFLLRALSTTRAPTHRRWRASVCRGSCRSAAPRGEICSFARCSIR